MIIITQPSVTEAQIDHIVARIEEYGLRSEVMRGQARVVIGVIGPDEVVREKPLGAIPGVESVVPVMKPYKLVAQENGSLPPPVSIGDVKIGSGQRVVLISGPCSVESKERLLTIAKAVKKAGARVVRGSVRGVLGRPGGSGEGRGWWGEGEEVAEAGGELVGGGG